MPNFDIKLGLKEVDGFKSEPISAKISGTVSTVMEWITETLGFKDKTVHDIHHLEIIEKED